MEVSHVQAIQLASVTRCNLSFSISFISLSEKVKCVLGV